jgi:hypothetical protein
MKRLALLLATGLLVLASAAPAAAAKPITYWDGDYDYISDPFYDLCPFGVVYHGVGHESYREWQDATGFPVKGLYQNQGTDSFINALTGTTVSGKFRFTSHLSDWMRDAEADTWTWQEQVTGAWWNIQLPAQGTVFHESGRMSQSVVAPTDDSETWIYTVSRLVGNSTFDVDALCEALAE